MDPIKVTDNEFWLRTNTELQEAIKEDIKKKIKRERMKRIRKIKEGVDLHRKDWKK